MIDRDYRVDFNCPCCGAMSHVMVNRKNYEQWKLGVHVQDAFPYLTAAEREAIMTGTCSKCWDELFK